MNKKQYRSYSKAIVTAINDHFERQARLASDPYLETREKEDTFLRRVTEAIEQSLRFAPVGMLSFTPPATGSFVAERVSLFTTPFSFLQKETKTRIRCFNVSHKAKRGPVAGRPLRGR